MASNSRCAILESALEPAIPRNLMKIFDDQKRNPAKRIFTKTDINVGTVKSRLNAARKKIGELEKVAALAGWYNLL